MQRRSCVLGPCRSQCVFYQLGKVDTSEGHEDRIKLLVKLRERNKGCPVFLDQRPDHRVEHSPLLVMQHADDFIWLLEDTPDFISGRILAAIDRYRVTVLPPMFGALVQLRPARTNIPGTRPAIPAASPS